MVYDPTLTNPRDKVRLLIGDVETPSIFSDAEIDFFLSENSSVYYASAIALESLAARYSGKVDKQVGDLRIKYSDKSKQYLAMAAILRARASKSTLGIIYIGGLSVSEHESDAADTGLTQPAFTKDMHDYQLSDPRNSGAD